MPSQRFAERFARRGVAAALAILATACGPPTPEEDLAGRVAALDRPHIVLLLVDTLRADWLEPYGYDGPTSPELQRWAEQGVVFERVLAQSSWTKVSMASMLTSLWPRSHGVKEATDGLGEGALTVAEVLRDAGYATAAVQSNGWLEQSFGFEQGFDHYVFPRADGAARALWVSSIWPHGDRVLEEGRRLIEARDRDRPLFLYLHFMDVHEYAAPPEHRIFGNDERGFYLASIRWTDEVLGRVRTLLEREGMLENTVLVLASDHGETFGENQRHGHAFNVYSPVLRVPLVFKLPFDVPARRVTSQVRNLDIAPTLLELAGVTAPEGFEGRSLVPLIVDPQREADRPSFASLPANIMRTADLQTAVNDGTWTFVRDLDADARERLFDLEWDPDEDANLVEFEPAAATRMRGVLDGHLEVEPRAGVSRGDVRIDPAIAERLRAVGYLE